MYNHQLDTFIVVADSGSFNKAAEALFISPPAVIKQINLLEDSLGVRLFTRTHRGLQLTKAGQSVYEDARYIIAYCRESVERAKKADDTQPSVLRIGTSTMTPGQTVVDMWTQIREEIPDIKFQLVPFENTPENAREILKNMGKNIEIRTYRMINRSKEFEGVLKAYDKDSVTIETEAGETLAFQRNEIALIRQAIDF